MAVPDRILISSATVVGFFGGLALDVVLDALDPVGMAGSLLRDKRAANASSFHQVAGNVSELRWEILVDEQNVHVGSGVARVYL